MLHCDGVHNVGITHLNKTCFSNIFVEKRVFLFGKPCSIRRFRYLAGMGSGKLSQKVLLLLLLALFVAKWENGGILKNAF